MAARASELQEVASGINYDINYWLGQEAEGKARNNAG